MLLRILLIYFWQAMREDPHIRVLRVKNRMARTYNAEPTGYRDVLLNLTIDTPLTRELGVYKHVCELQLILEPLMLLKSAEGHTRYVEFRNKRCE